jgi:polyisoprenoid-binding protein YceI
MTRVFGTARLRQFVVTVCAAIIVGLASDGVPAPSLAGAATAKSKPDAMTGASLPGANSFAIDPVHTFVRFSAQHKVVGRVIGRFDRSTGTITVAEKRGDCTADVAIEAASLSTQNPIRDEDVRGKDFLDVANHPNLEYHGRGIRPVGMGWVMDGTLTIRGIAKPVPLSFEFRGLAPPEAGKPARVAFHASAVVKRADFGMTRELLDEIGKVSDAPDVWIEIDAELLATTHADTGKAGR